MKLILDYNKWRCGGDSTITKYDDGSNSSFTTIDNTNKLGEGDTKLLNDQGYMCCLGQFSLQLNTTISSLNISGFGEPGEIEDDILLLTSDYGDGDGYSCRNTSLSDEAMTINDDSSTTPEEKIVLLQELFAKADCEIEVINLS